MSERKFLVSASQLFCFVFFYLLSGMMLFCGGSFIAAVFASLFCVCLCIVASAVCRAERSSLLFYSVIFGKFGALFRLFAAFFSAYPFVRTLFAISDNVSVFHSVQNKALFAPLLALLCVLSAAKCFSRAARFAEVCVFPLFAALVLSLLGGGGDGISFGFTDKALFSGFDVIGAVPVFFSLYMRNVSEESEKMSDFAKNSLFHPSPLGTGLFAILLSLAVYVYFCFAGWGNILLSFLSWFFALVRLSLFALTFSELLAYPEEGNGAKCTFMLCLFCSFWAIFGTFYPNAAKIAGIFAAVIFPCAVFALTIVSHGRTERANE